jgi:hypothetical protein
MPRTVKPAVAAVLGFAALTIAMTWPLLSPAAAVVPDSDDAYFSVWRLAWFAHQLPKNPLHLFDANVFHPAPGTLAFSDAMVMVSMLGAPLIWAGVPPALAHNLLLAAAFISSMWFAFLLVRKLTGSAGAAWIAALIFGFAPYRFAHIGHLELQWTMWMPLSMWLLHRFFEAPSAGRGIAVGAALAGQTFCSIYYGVFLACYLAAAWTIFCVVTRPQPRRIVPLSALMLAPLVVVALVYGPPYAHTRAEQGPRGLAEMTGLSAMPGDFLRVPPHNALRGSPQDPGPAPDERSLYPGAAALLLAAAAFLSRPRRWAVSYAALAALSVDLALGMNGLLLPALQQLAPLVTSLRTPARFGSLMLLSVAVLAGLGAAAIFRARPARRHLIVAIATLLCISEYWSAPLRVRGGQGTPTDAHQWLASQPPGTVVLELPVPSPDALWLYETTYQVRSIHHWQPLINGYSGFAPGGYINTLELLRGFPNEPSVKRLRELGVRFILLNRVFYSGTEFAALIGTLRALPAFWPPQAFGGGENQIVVVELKQTAP